MEYMIINVAHRVMERLFTRLIQKKILVFKKMIIT